MSGRRMDTRRQHRDEDEDCKIRNQADHAGSIRTVYSVGQSIRTAGLGAVVAGNADSHVDGQPGMDLCLGGV